MFSLWPVKWWLSPVSADPGTATSRWGTGEAAALCQLAFSEAATEVLRVLPPGGPKMARSLTRTHFPGLPLAAHPAGDFKADA